MAVVYPDQLNDHAQVRCQRCQTVLCTLAEFRLVAGRNLSRFESSVARRSYAFFMSSPGIFERWYRRLVRWLGAGASRRSHDETTALRTGR